MLSVAGARSVFASDVFVTVTFPVSAFLLVTMGAAIVGAPLTVPALTVIARTRRGWKRAVSVALAMLTVAEVGWAATYVVAAEAKPWIWVVPVLCAATTGALLPAPWRRARQ
ncbi:MAG TPA: hypothetical protein VFN21_04160 [Acidimicrobiales bacterium]|nr:hypothetical protein [Acidimicrobiales bacterium]